MQSTKEKLGGTWYGEQQEEGGGTEGRAMQRLFDHNHNTNQSL